MPTSLLWRCSAFVQLAVRRPGHAAGSATRMIHAVVLQAVFAAKVRRPRACPVALGAGCSQQRCGVWRSFVGTAPAACIVRCAGTAGVSLRCVQPELKAVLQPYGADRVSARGARAAGVLTGAWLVGWCRARTQAAARCGREGLGASAGAHPSGHRGNARRLVGWCGSRRRLGWAGRGV